MNRNICGSIQKKNDALFHREVIEIVEQNSSRVLSVQRLNCLIITSIKFYFMLNQ